MNIIHSISIMGDSILRGVVLNNNTKKYSISNTINMDSIAQMYSIEVTNLSRFGCTVDRGYEYVSRFLQKGNRTDALMLELGGNDSDFNWADIATNPDAEHSPKTPLDKFTEIYRNIIKLLRDHKILPVITTLPPVCPERYLDWVCRDGLDRDAILHWLGGSPNTIYRYQENYSRAIEGLAAESGSVCVDLRGAFLANRRIDGLYCEDGIHPNEAGQLIIRKTLISTLEKHKGAIVPC